MGDEKAGEKAGGRDEQVGERTGRDDNHVASPEVLPF